MKTLKILSIIGVMTFALYSFTTFTQEEWKVPEKYENMKNPTDPAVDIAIGKSLYSKHCKSCHGSKGRGDGPKADSVDTEIGDFTEDAFKEQSDGALYYKTFIGRDDMPSFKKKITDEKDQWMVINYIKKL